MIPCSVCGKPNDPKRDGGTLRIEGVPESTFNLSCDTVTLSLMECEGCGAAQMLSDTPLGEDYDVVYRSIGVSSTYRNSKKSQLSQFLDTYELHDKRVIEVGCGDGQFLELLKEIGLDCCGVEAGNENIETCRKKGLDAHSFDFLTDDDAFDAFMTFHYLEHLPEPRAFAETLYRILRPGGIGLVEVPNYDHIKADNVWLEFTKDHRIYYTKRALSCLLLGAGFGIESVEEHADGLCLTMVVRKPDGTMGLASMGQEIEDTKMRFRELVDGLDGPFAVYGAGHYSQLLLSLVNLAHGIRPAHIFDSNRQKCGGEICGVVVEHRDAIPDMTDCDHIIVNCGAYNGEVQRMLTEMELGKNILVWR